tara:strand:- start:3834 stop:5210 length:1377 start_codon:yes stop_codon:yes gene_type:complete
MRYLLIIVIPLLFGKISSNFSVTPIAFLNSYSKGGIISPYDDPVLWAGYGLNGNYKKNNFHFSTELVFTRYWNLINVNNFSNVQGPPYYQSILIGSDMEHDAQISNMKIDYINENISVQIGKFSRTWGPGINKLLLSDKTPAFEQFGFFFEFNDKINFESFHGKLLSELFYAPSDIPDSPLLMRNRFIAGHRLNWKPFKGINFGLNEMVIYGDRDPELVYQLPFVFFYAVQNYLGDRDNVLWSFDLDWHINEKINIYSSILIDDFDYNSMFNKINNNKIGIQLGTILDDVIIPNDNFFLEFIWTHHSIYTHKHDINYAYNTEFNYPIGFWGGPHAEHLNLGYGINKWDIDWILSYSYSKRGQVTDEMIEQYHRFDYNRFTGPVEELQLIELKIKKVFLNNILVQFSLQNFDWLNPNFDPFDPDDDEFLLSSLSKTKKISFNLEVLYNFNLPGLNSPYH